MVVTDEGMVISCKLEHWEKHPKSICHIESDKVILLREVQLWNVLSPIIFTESGIVILFKLIQC